MQGVEGTYKDIQVNKNMKANAEGPSAGCRIEVCRGVERGCVHALPVDSGLIRDLEQAVLESGFQKMQAKVLGAAPKGHHAFRISIAACPNGCSRPQVADLGLLAAQAPFVVEEAACTECGACELACPDKAIHLTAKSAGVAVHPVIDTGRCLQCKKCVQACAFGVLAAEHSALRIQVGGKLGRRPLLAAELSGTYGADAVQLILSAVLHELMRRYRPGMRVADMRHEFGDQWIQELPCGS